MQIARIDETYLTADDLVKTLKLLDRFDAIIEPIMERKLTVLAAKKMDINVTQEEIQQRFDYLRRVHQLHRAIDTEAFFEAMQISVDEMAEHLREDLLCEKTLESVVNDETVEQYFRLHSPLFETIELSRIVLEHREQAHELIELLSDAPDQFAHYAREYSSDTSSAESGGLLGEFARGALSADVEAQLFNAEIGKPIGPFTTSEQSCFEIYQVSAKRPPRLDHRTRVEIAQTLRAQWLSERAEEHILEVI